MNWKEVLSTLLPLFLFPRKLLWTSFSQIRTGLGVPQFDILNYSGHEAYCMEYTSCAKRAAARIENEPVTAVSLDLCHVLDINISLGHDLDEIFIFSSTMSRSHQSPRKQAAEAYEEHKCCTRERFVLYWDGEMFPEIRGDRSLDRSAVLITGYGQENLPNVSDGRGGEAGPTCVDLVQEHHKQMKGLSPDTSASKARIREPVSWKRRPSRSNFLTAG